MGSFITTIQGVRNGALVAQLSEALDEVTRAVVEHQQVGELTIKLKIKPNSENQVTFIPSLSVKTPRAQIGAAIFYADEDGALLRSDPRQIDIFADELGAKRAAQQEKA